MTRVESRWIREIKVSKLGHEIENKIIQGIARCHYL